MRILFVLENYYPNIGGVETLFKYLIDHLVEAGNECVVITSQLSPNDPLLEEEEGLTLIRIPVSNRYFFTFKALWPILKCIRSCDFVQTTSYNAGLPAFIAAKLYRKKILITFHEAWGKLWFQLPFMGLLSKTFHYLFEQFLLFLPFDRFIAVSQNTAKRLLDEGVSAKRVITIYNGIDYKEFETEAKQPLETTEFTFTYFGRLGVSKGLDLLLEAAALISKELPESRLQLIIPTVPLSFLNWVKNTIRGNNLADFVQLRHDLPFETLKKAIVTSNCVVIPSYSEGFCFAAVETGALGVPIVSSDRAALPEVISGRFVRMETLSTAALVDAMRKAYRGAWEERPLRRFALEDTVQNYLKLYSKMIEKG